MQSEEIRHRIVVVVAVVIAALALSAGCSSRGHRRAHVPPPPPPAGICLGNVHPGDIVEWEAAIDYPGDVDEFVIDPSIVPGDLLVRIFGQTYGLDMVFEIYDPLGNWIDTVDDTIGYDPEALYELDICGPWIVRAYAYDDSVGPYDLYTEYF